MYIYLFISWQWTQCAWHADDFLLWILRYLLYLHSPIEMPNWQKLSYNNNLIVPLIILFSHTRNPAFRIWLFNSLHKKYYSNYLNQFPKVIIGINYTTKSHVPAKYITLQYTFRISFILIVMLIYMLCHSLQNQILFHLGMRLNVVYWNTCHLQPSIIWTGLFMCDVLQFIDIYDNKLWMLQIMAWHQMGNKS